MGNGARDEHLAMGQAVIFSGVLLKGERVDQRNKNFSMMLQISSVNEMTSNFSGELFWPSLNSLHRIENHVEVPSPSRKYPISNGGGWT